MTELKKKKKEKEEKTGMHTTGRKKKKKKKVRSHAYISRQLFYPRSLLF